MSEKLGITREDAQAEFIRLFQETTELEKEIQKLQKEIQELKDQMETVRDEAAKKEVISKIKEFRKKLDHAANNLRYTKESLTFTRDGYSVYILESLEDETQKLGGLTNQLDSDVKSLHSAAVESSGVLEYLTRILIAVTILIATEPLILQFFGALGLPILAIALIAVTAVLTSYSRRKAKLGVSKK